MKNQEKHVCDFCDQEFCYDWASIHDSCGTVDGQFFRFSAVICPHCQCTNGV